ncbi:MAG: hypothetical protein ACM3YN_03145 [Parcubacteria group bacterium]
MADNPAPKIASDPDWFWRDLNAGRGAGLYGEILPDRRPAPEELAAEAAAPAPQPLTL